MWKGFWWVFFTIAFIVFAWLCFSIPLSRVRVSDAGTTRLGPSERLKSSTSSFVHGAS